VTIELEGNWRKGRAFDVHVMSSVYLGPNEAGYDHWENTRSEMGELVYQLKYGKDKSKLEAIVTLLDKIKGVEHFDYIIPIPPTDKSREFQPVSEIALALGRRRGLNVLTDFLAKKPGGQQLKNVDDPDERANLLKELLYIQSSKSLKGKCILLVDDLFRSGATLRAATDLLLNEAEVADVCVLTMTKTKSKR
jgi:competence protein ComFC